MNLTLTTRSVRTQIAAQLEEVKRFAASKGYEIVEEFVDAGITGRTEDRPEFSRLRKIISSGKAYFEAVIVWRSNRFARSSRVAQGFRFLLERRNIRLLSVTEPEMNGSTGVLMNGILDAFNEFYSAQLGEDTFRGMAAAAKQGYAMGGIAPYGLKKVPVILDSGGIKKKYAIVEEEAAIIRQIYQMYVDGMGLYVIARELTKRGVKTKKGRDWEQSSVHHILHKNRHYYLGNTVFNRTKTVVKKLVGQKDQSEWIIVEGTHEAIITQELADAVDRQRDRADKPRFQSPTPHGRNQLNGLVYCGLCGARVGGQYANSGKRENGVVLWYYACNARKNSTKLDKSEICSNGYVRQEIMEDAVNKELEKFFCNPKRLKKVLLEAQRELSQGEGEKESRSKQLMSERADLEKRRANLLDAVEQGMLPLVEIAERLEKTRGRLKEIDVLLEDLGKAPKQTSYDDTQLGDVADYIKQCLKDPQRRREIYVTFIERIDLYMEEIVITFRLPDLRPDSDDDGSERKKSVRKAIRGTLPYVNNSPLFATKREFPPQFFTSRVPLPLPRRAGWLLSRYKV